METRQIEFAKLRHAYVTVKSFIDKEAEGYNELKSLDTKIRADIGLSGHDNLELLEKFVEKFELDYKDFEYDKHFYSEGELYGSEAALFNLLTLSVWLPLKTIELITFNKIKINKPKFPVTPDREVSDLTFKDLLTWYIEKEFKPSDKIKYVIKTSQADT
jgi:hypothetical protein